MILVVDDDANMLEMLSMALKEYSATTSSPHDAVRIMAEGNITLLITDYAMPELDGLRIAKLAKNLYNIPSIIMTGHSEKVDFLKTRVDKVIEKPFTIKELKSVIIKTLDKQYEYENK